MWIPLLVALVALVGVLVAPTVCALPREESVLEVVTVPSGAEVTVDDEYVGRTPLRLELAPGAHWVEFTPAGGCPVEERVELSPGAVTVLELVAPLY